MKYILLPLVCLSFVAHARPAPGELPTQESRNKAEREYQYRRAYLHCSQNPMIMNYCMALSLQEVEFCKKSEVTTQRECVEMIRAQKAEIK